MIVITGNILAGKSTLAKYLEGWGYKKIVEYTTRPVRPGERDGKDYHFVSDREFSAMEDRGEFVEVLHVDTVHGPWSYGAKKSDLTDDGILVCGPRQTCQMLDSGIEGLFVLLDIDEGLAMKRGTTRGDNSKEVERRFYADCACTEELKSRVGLVLDSKNRVWENAAAVDRLRAKKYGGGYRRAVNSMPIVTAQEMGEMEIHMYLSGSEGLNPYLRMKDHGMPKNPINQIAWLLLNGTGCGFCKVCREKPCVIKDDEKCTANIADYIRECVHKEDEERSERNGKI